MIVCSGILYLFYRLVLDRKAPLSLCRGYLLGSIILAAVIPALCIPVYVEEVIELPALTPIISTDNAYMPVIEEMQTAVPFMVKLYVAVTVLTLAILLFRFLKIQRYKLGASIQRTRFYTLFENIRVKSPFSFFRNIFVSPGYTRDELTQIISHEMSHIRHRHSVELVLMDIFKSLF